MPDPKQHSEDRNFVEDILRHIPGFKGYLEKEYRRESDQLARTWLADQLQRGKQGLSEYGRVLLDSAQIDALADIDRLNSRLDRAISRLRGQMPGYSGFFDYVRINEDDLNDAYEHDMQLMELVKQLAGRLEALPEDSGPPSVILRDVLGQVDKVLKEIDKREEILAGLN